jgi:polyhydroxyalkanoate synthase
MPQTLHLFYLREFYQHNKLAKGELELGGVKLNLKKVTIPVFLQSGREDHIAPCKSIFKMRKLFGGPTEFIVAGSGHIAGVINPPAAGKYQHWTGGGEARSLDKWWESAEEHPGSWWPHWLDWLKPLSGKKVPARIPGAGKLPVIEDAPGSYVKTKS